MPSVAPRPQPIVTRQPRVLEDHRFTHIRTAQALRRLLVPQTTRTLRYLSATLFLSLRTPKTRILERTSTAETRAQIGHIIATSHRRLRVSHDFCASTAVQSDLLSASSIPEAASSAPVGSAQTSVPKSDSKAWIAGAVVGPILGLALVGAGVWFFLRRKKKAARPPQHGSASMAPMSPNQPPAGVGGYTDAKPQFSPAQPTYYERPGQSDQFAQQGYPQQGGFSPAQQYGFQPADQQSGSYTHNTRHEGVSGTAELGDGDKGISIAVPISELSGVDTKPPGEGSSKHNKPR